MTLSLDILKALQPNGQPLDLHVTLESGSQDEEKFKDRTYRVDNSHGDSFTMVSQDPMRKFIQRLKAQLTFYPDEARVNFEEVSRREFPDLAQVTTTTYKDGESDRDYRVEHIDLGFVPQYNTLAGGVLCYLKILPPVKKTYYSALPGPHQNRQAARKVDISPVTVITPEEIAGLTQEEFNNLDSNGSTPLETSIRRRAEEQIQRTLDRPDVPRPHEGPVFRYSLMAPGKASIPFENGAPIIVNGTPVILPEDLYGEPEDVAIAEALYRADSPFVPVSLTQEQMKSPPPHQTMTSFSFHFKPEKPDPTGWCMEQVQEIIMKFTLEDSAGESRTHQVEADFHFTDDKYGDKRVRFVPGRVTPESLAEYMLRAYWDEERYSSWDELKDGLEELHEEYLEMATAAMEDPVRPYLDQLKKLANRFFTEIPTPDQELTATSHDGRITVTSRPGPAAHQNQAG